MYPIESGKTLIDKAAEIAGSQRKLAAMLEIEHANLVKIKKGERPANWRIRGGLRVILGEDPARAFIAAIAEDLENSEKPDEKKAAQGLAAMLEAFPERKSSVAIRRIINVFAQNWHFLAGLVASDKALGCRSMNAELLAESFPGVRASSS